MHPTQTLDINPLHWANYIAFSIVQWQWLDICFITSFPQTSMRTDITFAVERSYLLERQVVKTKLRNKSDCQSWTTLQQSRGNKWTVLACHVVQQGWPVHLHSCMLSCSKLQELLQRHQWHYLDRKASPTWLLTWTSYSVSATFVVITFEGDGGWKGFLCQQWSHPTRRVMVSWLTVICLLSAHWTVKYTGQSTTGGTRHVSHEV